MRLGRRPLSAPAVALLAAAVLFALFVVNVLMLAGIQASRSWISRTRQAHALLSAIRGSLADAETGQRGFLLTGRADYLQPFQLAAGAIPASLADLKRLTIDDPAQKPDVAELESLATRKLDELRGTVELYRRGETAAALAIVRSDQGKALMDGARRVITEMRSHEDRRLEDRTMKARRKLDLALWIDGGAGIGLLALGFVLFTINRDMARREELEKALREAASFQEQFVAILGHDLRNPLGAISMAALRLQGADLPEALAKSVAHVSSSAGRIRRMVDQLLDLTRARLAGGIPVQPRPDTDLGEIARGAIEELRSANPGADLRVDSATVVRGSWDPDRMTQVVSNLAANAIQYGVGPIEVRVSHAGASAVLEVHNAGAPIPPDLMPRLFEAFHRSTDDSGGRRGGLGLGLFIAERIVIAHGGKITVRSTAREGTTFTVELPADGPPRALLQPALPPPAFAASMPASSTKLPSRRT